MEGIAEKLIRLGVPTLYEAAGRRGLMQGVRLISGPAFAGRAQTAEIPAGDNLGLHLGLREQRTAEVYCVASAGQGRYGVIGELLMEQLRTAGWTAIVVDDGVRDIDLLNPPPSVAARGICSRGTVKLRSGPLGREISIGATLVRPGDWIVGDRDGVMVVPADRLSEVIKAARERFAKEARIAELVRSGLTVMEANRLATSELDKRMA
jgi:4-hydroxy-4-methyl-2-oxoglutarate aldolase